MEYKQLGKTGLRVSELCLGAMTFGRETEEEVSYHILDRFVDAGGNFIDTADVYSLGGSETIVGLWLKEHKRDDIVIATKVRFPMGEKPNEYGLSRKHILAGVHASLKRLQTDYIDLYQVHRWDAETPLVETLSTLNDLVKTGKVRYIGCSNFTGWQLQKAIELSRANGWEHFVCLQPLYNLLDRAIEWELIPICINEGLGIIPWSPLRGGWLSGRYKKGMKGPEKGSRVHTAGLKGWQETWEVYANPRTWAILDEVFAVAKEAGKEPAQVALRWLMQQPQVTAPILGVRTIAHLETNLGAAGWSLTEEQMARLDQISYISPPYPYNM
jgi:aryl-alcohol dehydrogenase-like predicted oxidoreductase